MTAKNKVDAKSITSDQLEEMFDDGDDILDYVDLDNPVVEHHPPLEKRITLSSTHGSPTGCAPCVAAKSSTPDPIYDEKPPNHAACVCGGFGGFLVIRSWMPWP